MPLSPERQRELYLRDRPCENCAAQPVSMIQLRRVKVALCARCAGALRRAADAKPALKREDRTGPPSLPTDP